ncbi:hypothetical protein [Arthrobacter mangrovi]|nr:hypothetical protein [Arthrobacter mangrovi]
MGLKHPAMLTTAVPVLLAAVTACGASLGSGGRACTEIGAAPGVSLTVAREFVPEVKAATLEICWQGTCRRSAVDLYPGQDTVDLGCDTAAPEGSCSATSTPNGTLTGFAAVPQLPEGQVRAAATITRLDGTETETGALETATRMVYPNGEQCPGAVPQLGLTLDHAGLHPSRR